MKIKTYAINETGLESIHAHLAEKHRLGGEHFTRDMLMAWAGEAEESIANGNDACFEISSFDSVSGHTELCWLDLDRDFNAEEIEVDE